MRHSGKFRIVGLWMSVGLSICLAAAAADLPAAGSPENPMLRLTLGKDKAADVPNTVTAGGSVCSHKGDEYTTAGKAEAVSAHKGSGEWSAAFQFALTSTPVDGEHVFWASWKQGGDPKVCAQQFTVLAGPDEGGLEERGTFRLTNSTPWQFQWVRGDKTLMLKKDDKLIEVRNTGRGVDAKVFNGFLFAPAGIPQP